jgi:hypothetical protein
LLICGWKWHHLNILHRDRASNPAFVVDVDTADCFPDFQPIAPPKSFIINISLCALPLSGLSANAASLATRTFVPHGQFYLSYVVLAVFNSKGDGFGKKSICVVNSVTVHRCRSELRTGTSSPVEYSRPPETEIKTIPASEAGRYRI